MNKEQAAKNHVHSIRDLIPHSHEYNISKSSFIAGADWMEAHLMEEKERKSKEKWDDINKRMDAALSSMTKNDWDELVNDAAKREKIFIESSPLHETYMAFAEWCIRMVEDDELYTIVGAISFYGERMTASDLFKYFLTNVYKK